MCFIPPLCIEYRTVSSCVIVRLFRDRPYFPFRAHAHTPEGFFMLQEIRRKFLKHKKRGISNLTAGYSSLLILYYFPGSQDTLSFPMTFLFSFMIQPRDRPNSFSYERPRFIFSYSIPAQRASHTHHPDRSYLFPMATQRREYMLKSAFPGLHCFRNILKI